MNTSNWEFTTSNQPPHTALPFATRDYLLVAIFSGIMLLLLLALLALYSLRKWRHTATSSLPPPNLTASVSSRLRSLGLGEEAIDRLPVSLHQSTLNDDLAASTTTAVDKSECCICLDVFEDQERIKVLPGCQHTYHSDCVDLWLGNQSSCPLCRVSLKYLISPLASSSQLLIK
uniref:RING-type E3 ubiquitin transferase n=1 Tax=Kalanchoe fedtschenkoi TaxID=63787 RepID=A0A7N0VJZ4_KALFE